jgi:uncharacterized nucleotidyltransferase DUF6036
MVIIGGSAAALAYAVRTGTVDVDTFETDIAALTAALAAARTKTGLFIPVQRAAVADLPCHYESRLVRELPHLLRLLVRVPERHDLVLSKLMRCHEGDLQCIEEVHLARNQFEFPMRYCSREGSGRSHSPTRRVIFAPMSPASHLTGRSLLKQIEEMHDLMAGAEGCFDVELRKARPLSERQLKKLERDLRTLENVPTPLPRLLRQLYALTRSVGLYWNLTKPGAERFGYQPGEEPYGQLEMIPADKLDETIYEPLDLPGAILFTSDGYGNGYCLDGTQARKGRVPVVWYQHDVGPTHGRKIAYPDVEHLFAAWVRVGFVHKGSWGSSTRAIERFLRTGKLPPTPSSPRVHRRSKP